MIILLIGINNNCHIYWEATNKDKGACEEYSNVK